MKIEERRIANPWTIDYIEGKRTGMEDGVIIGKSIAMKKLEEFISDKRKMFNYIGHAEEFINDFKKILEK